MASIKTAEQYKLDQYTNDARSLLNRVEASLGEGSCILSFTEVVFRVITNLKEIKRMRRQVILIGNGGSAAIASEVGNRLWKFCGIKSLTFNDLVILTATANDYGWSSVFARPIRLYADDGDLLIAISSSGESENILAGIMVARQRGCQVMSLSGFQSANRLRNLGDINFYVPSQSYRHVERTHLFILDCIHDLFLEYQNQELILSLPYSNADFT